MRRINKVFLILFVVMGSLSALGGYFFAKDADSVFSEKYMQSLTKSVSADNTVFLNKDAMIEITYTYTFCGHKETVKGSASYFGFTGLTHDETAKKFKTVNIRKFSYNDAVIEAKAEEYCPRHFVLKFDEDELFIYKTDSKTASLRKYLELNKYRKSILPGYREELDIGVVFESTNEINRYLKEISK